MATALSFGTEIGLDHARLPVDVGCRSFRDRPFPIENVQALAHAHDHAHIVFDRKGSASKVLGNAGDRPHQLIAFGFVEARGRLVKQQELRAQRQCAGEADPARAIRSGRDRVMSVPPMAICPWSGL